MNFSLTAIESIKWVTWVLSLYFIFDSAGKLANYDSFRQNGFFGSKTLKTSLLYTSRHRFIRAILDIVFEFRVWLFLNILRGIGGLVLFILPKQNLMSTFCLLFLFLSSSLINFRTHPFGPETDSRFSLQITGALLLNALVPTPLVNEVCLWFIALQSCISYATAGVSKLFKKEWRTGNGLSMIILARQMIFSDRMVVFFSGQKTLLKVITWTTIGMDSLFPLVLILGKPYFLIFIVWGICFHLFIAIFLRLGKFFWVWVATYPAIIYIALNYLYKAIF